MSAQEARACRRVRSQMPRFVQNSLGGGCSLGRCTRKYLSTKPSSLAGNG
jgi:hypothetical protein